MESQSPMIPSISDQPKHTTPMRRIARTAQIAVPVLAIIALAVLLLTRGATGRAGDSAGNGGGSGTSGGAGTTTLQGTVLDPVRPAPLFSLKDQHGSTISLAQLRGHLVVLTFLDSVCPHGDCQLLAQYLDLSAQYLRPQQATQVDWLAMSVDPWHDTPTTVQAFLTGQHVRTPIHFLLGTQAQLAPLWKAYYQQAILQPDGVVAHTTGVYIIDQQGRERVWLDEGFDPKALAADLRLLLAQH